MDLWLQLHEQRSADLVREAEVAHRRRVLQHRRTTPYVPVARTRATDVL